MITGQRLSEMLSFHRAGLQEEVLKAASSLLAVNRRLDSMRLEEAMAWARYAGGDPGRTRLQEGMKEAKAVAEARHARMESVIGKARAADEEAAALRPRLSAAAERLAAARAGFEAAEKAALERAEADPETALLRHAAETVRQHKARIEGWTEEAFARSRPLLESFDSDPAFAYLHGRGYGTASYKAGPVARVLDRWLAKKALYEEAAKRRARVAGYLEESGVWLAKCNRMLREIDARLQAVADRAMADADGPRSRLAEALNEENAASLKLTTLDDERREALMTVIDMALGRDSECQVLTERLVGLIARERAEATMRAAASPEGPDRQEDAEIDRIVRERVSLSMEADGLRMNIAIAAARLKALEDVDLKLRLRGWHRPDVSFSLEELTLLLHDLAAGRIGADEAWADIEASLAKDSSKQAA